jgi:hypothetical protein
LEATRLDITLYRFKTKLSLKPLKVVEVESPIKKGKVGSAIQDMKLKMSSLKKSDGQGSDSPTSNVMSQLDYIFTVPEESDNMTEQIINNFLNDVGIFQIHLSGVMKEYEEMYAN